jgi:membrane protein implicated in regulation of membrane protease activity
VAELAASISFWHWIVLGVVFITAEAFVPGAFFLGMGVSALVVGGALFAVPSMGWKLQLFTFAVLSVISIVIARRWIRRSPIESDQPLLNQRGARYVGRQFTLSEPIVNGHGKIKVDDSIWKVHGPDSPAHARVRVTGVDGTVLLVEAAGEDRS